ncbi:hypothetical protein LZ906_017395 (plasmid) [Paraclostridium ghonii]|uniref:hypothetical protein n=1 Tax=Paraclostridium ghonii TaxID=29358 RepID=UPI00202CDBBF|nr:hypothetical protein [Paeniclostridium ghonii]MCM0167614.1 hypothetical protein [Paeniclostridium ghonii]
MIISKKTHEKIVSMKDADIKILENKLSGVKELLTNKNLELYEADKECNSLSVELEQIKRHLKDTDIALDLMINKAEGLEQENEALADKILNMREDSCEFQKEINSYKTRLKRIDSLKVQYGEYMNKAIESNVTTHTLTKNDIDKFLSKEGLKGIIRLYMLASLM